MYLDRVPEEQKTQRQPVAVCLCLGEAFLRCTLHTTCRRAGRWLLVAVSRVERHRLSTATATSCKDQTAAHPVKKVTLEVSGTWPQVNKREKLVFSKDINRCTWSTYELVWVQCTRCWAKKSSFSWYSGRKTGSMCIFYWGSLNASKMTLPYDVHSTTTRHCSVFQMAFILTGCDFASYFKGHGTVAFLDTLTKRYLFISGFRDLAECDRREHSKGLLAFVRLILGAKYFEEHGSTCMPSLLKTLKLQSVLGKKRERHVSLRR